VANNRSKKSNKNNHSQSRRQGQGTRMKGKNSSNKEITAIILFAATILLFLCFIGQVGIVGNVICSIVFGLVGQVAAYLLLVFFIYMAWNMLRGNKGVPGVRGTFFFVVLTIAISAFIHTIVFRYNAESGYFENAGHLLNAYKEGLSGGIIGGSLSFILQKFMTEVGAFVVLVPVIIVSAMLLFSFSISNIVRKVANAGNRAGAGIKRIKDRFDEESSQEAEKREARERALAEEEAALEKEGFVNTRKNAKKKKDNKFGKFYDKMRPSDEDSVDSMPLEEADRQDITEFEEVTTAEPILTEPDFFDNLMPEFDEEEILPPLDEGDFAELQGINFGEDDFTEEMVGTGKMEEPKPEDSGEPFVAPELHPGVIEKPKKPYKKPPVSLLAKSPGKTGSPAARKALMNQNARKLESVLESFGISAKVINISQGPSVTRYELQPSSGVKVSRIKNLSDDLALNLAVTSIRIEAPIPGKAAIGIEIPNTEVDTVYLRDIIESQAFKNNNSKVSFCLGENISGEAVVADLVKMPHLLVAGTTGAGKSICINCLILSILYNATPDEVKLILIDPKQVEFVPYEGVPHLFVPVVKEARKAAGALAWAVAQMNERYKSFSEVGVRDIKGYNNYAEANGLEKLPQIVIIIDELADLMMVAHDTVEDSVCRLAQMARAAGMHLVIATQRPSVDVITGIIKANIPSRIALKVASQVDSRTIIDGAGAEKLLGRGDMMFLPLGSVKGTRIQGAFVSDGEVEAVVNYLKENNSDTNFDQSVIDNFNASLTQESEKGSGRSGGAEPGEDELLPKAIDIAIDLKQISASFLQRKLGVGYNRAARLIDQMEERGIIGGKDGSNPRQVLMSRAEFESQQ